MECSDMKRSNAFYCIPDKFLNFDEWNEKKYYRQSKLKKIFNSKLIIFKSKSIKYSTKEFIANLFRGKNEV